MDINTLPQDTQSTGYIIIRVSTARGAIPLEDASISIRGGTPENSGIVYSLKSDRDGLSPKISLPTPPASLSMTPGGAPPYSLWNVDVFRSGYLPTSYQNVPVYPSVVSVQPAVMIPISENFYARQRYNESEAPAL